MAVHPTPNIPASRLPLIIDCDPGIDDAIALLWAMASDALDILAITTVAGNVPQAITQANARQVVAWGGKTHLKVYGGCPRPLLRPPVFAAHIHGDNGLGGLVLPPLQGSGESRHGVQVLLDLLHRAPEPVTIATLGPLTNLAVALIQVPSLISQIREVVIMGGARGMGNITPAAEFNFYGDPHAAQVVLSSGLPLTLIDLDLTHQVIATPERLAKIRALGSPIALGIVQMLQGYELEGQQRLGLSGPPIHDPCVIAYILHPELFTTGEGYAQVETQSPLTLGRSVVDFWGGEGSGGKVRVALTVDAEGLFDRLVAAIASLGLSIG